VSPLTNSSRTPIEHLLELLLTGVLAPNAPKTTEKLAERVWDFDASDTHVVVLGGGTGLSTIVGGNAQLPDWPNQPCAGIKEEFAYLDFVVCTTDDGGSTGRLLKFLPMIGIGDLRKLLIASIRIEFLRRKYGLDDREARNLLKVLHALFNHRFREGVTSFEILKNPLKAAPQDLRQTCPKSLNESFRELGTYISPSGTGPTISPTGHALGNLLLASSIFAAAKGRLNRSPGLREIQTGIDSIARMVGAPTGRIHAATATPGQLRFCYANGVEVYGQSKSAQACRGVPVDCVVAEFTRKPVVSASVLGAIRRADLIIYAPGSLYTSIIPILQIEPIVRAIRSNRGALKILGANSWIQEGETDISLKNQARGFLVSELIEAYDRNIPNGIEGLFDVVLSANLEHISGNILRNYALEGKSPIHLDRPRVEGMGLRSVEATLLSPEHQRKTGLIHHDPVRFTLAVRSLLYADRFLKNKKGYELRHYGLRRPSVTSSPGGDKRREAFPQRSPLLCDYLISVDEALRTKDFRPSGLKDLMLELAWENRDIRHSHLSFFRGAIAVPNKKWNRSTEWDNVLGYYDPEDQYIKLHEELLRESARLPQDLLVALGESLLGRYIAERRWTEQNGARCYEIILNPGHKQESFLGDSQIRTYLMLARMTPDSGNNRAYRITINPNEGFLPPGLLFGLMYAWYLCGAGFTMEYEMTLLRWPTKSLIPHHAQDRIRKEALVKFFREEIFGHRSSR
jgi:uncharacterized cofD-like protein